MNKRPLHLISLALTLIVALTSCNRQNTPEFASGRFRYKEKSNKQADESTVALQQRTRIEPIAPRASEELQTEQVNGKLHSIAVRNNRVAAPILTHKKVKEAVLANEKVFLNHSLPAGLNKPANAHARPHDEYRLLCVIIAIFIPFLGVGIFEGITINFWIDLLLTFLFYFPGLIFALIVILSD